MSTPDDDTLRSWIAAADPAQPWPGRDAAHDARLEELACAAPSLAAEVLRLRAELAALRAPQDGYITTSRPGAAIEVQERVLSPEEIAALDFGRKPFGGGR